MRFFVVLIFVTCLFTACDKKPAFKQAVFNGISAEISVKNLLDKQPEFYSVNIEGRNINFFVVLIKGEVQSYFNACITCAPKKLGFRAKDGYVTCGACNVSYPVDSLKDGIGNCFPIKLKGTRADDKYVLKKEDLMEGWKYF